MYFYSLAEKQSDIAEQSFDDAGVLGKLSDMTVQETKSTSEPYTPFKPKSRQGTSGTS